MPLIKLTTQINAPIEVCFNLARSIDLHTRSMQHTNEKAVGGIAHGLIGLNEMVTWQAMHFGLTLRMTVKITEMMFATSFTDEQMKGPFKKLKHRHIFQYKEANSTIMMDEFYFKSPMGFIGRFVNKLILETYMTNLLIIRNRTIKQEAENGNT